MKPSKKQQKKRWWNALKQAAKINRLQKSGKYLIVLNDELLTKDGRFYISNGDHLVWKDRPDSNVCYTYFINDPELDNGMYDTIKEYNKQFKDLQLFVKIDKKSLKGL